MKPDRHIDHLGEKTWDSVFDRLEELCWMAQDDGDVVERETLTSAMMLLFYTRDVPFPSIVLNDRNLIRMIWFAGATNQFAATCLLDGRYEVVCFNNRIPNGNYGLGLTHNVLYRAFELRVPPDLEDDGRG